MKKILLVPATISLVLSAFEVNAERYYASVTYFNGEQRAAGMDKSLRPRIGEFVGLDNEASIDRAGLAVGYDFGNQWQTEIEYSTKSNARYLSGSSRFPSSLNNYDVDSEKLMINSYRFVPMTNYISVFGQLGFGIAKVNVGGWQGNENRKFQAYEQSNLAYSLGAGVRAYINVNLAAQVGYRYTNLGQVESGLNNFDNNNGNTLRDEQLKADLADSEFYFGMSYYF